MSEEAPAPALAQEAEAKEQTEAERLKKLGNDAFAAKNYDVAIKIYTDAMAIDQSNPVLYSNRR